MSDPNALIWSVSSNDYTGGDSITCKYDPTCIVQNIKQLLFEAKYVLDNGGEYHTARINSVSKFSFQYGYAEIRARVPQFPGLWSAFYLADDHNQPWPKLGEIDIFEQIGIGINSLALTVHAGIDPAHHVWNQHLMTPGDLQSQYHTIGIDWQASQIIWYIDGVDWFRSTIYVPQNPLYLYMTLLVNLPYAGDITQTQLPQYFDVDYVKVWQRN
jgi:beta-glucanase (GH16 family)